MARSLKKGPYVDYRLLDKAKSLQGDDKKSSKVVKTWSRACTIVPEFIGLTFAVHNGNKFIPVYITDNMVGHKLGEFSMTRKFSGHSGVKKAAAGSAPAADAKG